MSRPRTYNTHRHDVRSQKILPVRVSLSFYLFPPPPANRHFHELRRLNKERSTHEPLQKRVRPIAKRMQKPGVTFSAASSRTVTSTSCAALAALSHCASSSLCRSSRRAELDLRAAFSSDSREDLRRRSSASSASAAARPSSSASLVWVLRRVSRRDAE